MNFCENCNLACPEERCPNCGRKKLRSITDEDFCLVAKVDKFFGDNLKNNLEREEIDCVLMPYGTGIRSQFALPLESYLLYVRYKHLDYVRQLIRDESKK